MWSRQGCPACGARSWELEEAQEGECAWNCHGLEPSNAGFFCNCGVLRNFQNMVSDLICLELVSATPRFMQEAGGRSVPWRLDPTPSTWAQSLLQRRIQGASRSPSTWAAPAGTLRAVATGKETGLLLRVALGRSRTTLGSPGRDAGLGREKKRMPLLCTWKATTRRQPRPPPISPPQGLWRPAVLFPSKSRHCISGAS